jgi:hypothetical protein
MVRVNHGAPVPDTKSQRVKEVSAQTVSTTSPVLMLLDLGRRARLSASEDELVFQLVNGTHTLVPYRQAVLWTTAQRPRGLSGVTQPDINAPYMQWLKRLMAEHLVGLSEPTVIDLELLAEELREAWDEWMPAFGLYVPFEGHKPGGFLCVRDVKWREQEIALVREWCDIWCHAWRGLTEKGKARRVIEWRALRSWRTWLGIGSVLPWYKRRVVWVIGAVVIFFLFPVRLTVLAPGELVPTNPTIVRSPIEGVIANIFVKPNAQVEFNELLFDFDEGLLNSRATVAAQALETALATYRQTTQLALGDAKYKSELAAQAGAIEERRAEAAFLADQLKRSKVTASEPGVVLFDDASAWLGRQVTVGESVMRIVRLDDVEVEAWLPIADAVRLEVGSRVQLYLQSEPLSPVQAQLRYVAHQAVERPDGTYAYRVRASLNHPTKNRVGLKGTAKLESDRTTMFYWLFRRPLTVVRATLGI